MIHNERVGLETVTSGRCLEDWIGYEEPRMSTVNNSVTAALMKRWGNGAMLVSDSKDGREEPHWPDGTGRGGALEGLNTQWGMGKREGG